MIYNKYIIHITQQHQSLYNNYMKKTNKDEKYYVLYLCTTGFLYHLRVRNVVVGIDSNIIL